MLTGKMVRVRYARDRIIPHYIKTDDPAWLETAERLLELFRGQDGKTRGELEDEQREAFGDDPGQLVHQGLAKLLEDRCEFEVSSAHPPEQLRAAVFRAAARRRKEAAPETANVAAFDRAAVLREVGGRTRTRPGSRRCAGCSPISRVNSGSRKFKDLTAERLLQRYNVALAQAVLLRSTRVQVVIRNEPPQRYRQLLRRIKFHRLVCEVERLGPDGFSHDTSTGR